MVTLVLGVSSLTYPPTYKGDDQHVLGLPPRAFAVEARCLTNDSIYHPVHLRGLASPPVRENLMSVLTLDTASHATYDD